VYQHYREEGKKGKTKEQNMKDKISPYGEIYSMLSLASSVEELKRIWHNNGEGHFNMAWMQHGFLVKCVRERKDAIASEAKQD
jgi:hypothetical protein